MTVKKKRGIGLIASGVAFLVAGIFVINAGLPTVVPQIFSLIALVTNAIGIAFVYPNDKQING